MGHRVGLAIVMVLVVVTACGNSVYTPGPTPLTGPLVQPVWEAKHDLFEPTGIALDKSDNVYVVDSGNQRIVKFDASGAFVTAWGSKGDADGQFMFKSGDGPEFGAIGIDSQNEIFVADYTGRVQVFDPNGKLLRKWTIKGSQGPFLYVFSMALDRVGDLYFAADNQVQKFTPLGQVLGKWPAMVKFASGDGEFNQLGYVTVAPDGSIWTGEQAGERIQKFDPQMHFLGKWGTLGDGPGQYGLGIFGIAFDSRGRIWTVDDGGDRLEVYDSHMRFIGQSGHQGSEPGDFENPSYMAMDAQGDLYVVETGGGRIQKLHPLV
jgi:DNA-binding beta-propeller fold protein YncE